MYFRNNSDNLNNKSNILTFVRLLHASPDAPPVDVYVNNLPLIKDFHYKEFTNYVKLLPGKYNIKIVKSNNASETLYDTILDIPENKIFTIAAIGKFPNDFELYPIIESYTGPVNDNEVKIRIVNLIPESPNLDVSLNDNEITFNDLMYKEVENYKEIPPKKYSFDIKFQNTDITMLYIPNALLKPTKFYTLYLVGILGTKPGVEGLIPLDGITYLNHYSDM
ncbi:DUF4397 domain-containing protein [Clostridium sp. ATCC 25772]|uniref:DUF4397 domain-containing protein n=1 Tax=Clostridium sp. ATCC 25772 TaxID=1676991 RepID=UPI000781DF8C|nr:DUF4397 domain-containing protein [Clostridium sp. ATCC 25772]